MAAPASSGPFPIVEESVQRDFQRPRVLLQRLDCRDRVPVLDPGRIAALQPSALLDDTLAEILRFAEFQESLPYEHGVSVHAARHGLNIGRFETQPVPPPWSHASRTFGKHHLDAMLWT